MRNSEICANKVLRSRVEAGKDIITEERRLRIVGTGIQENIFFLPLLYFIFLPLHTNILCNILISYFLSSTTHLLSLLLLQLSLYLGRYHRYPCLLLLPQHPNANALRSWLLHPKLFPSTLTRFHLCDFLICYARRCSDKGPSVVVCSENRGAAKQKRKEFRAKKFVIVNIRIYFESDFSPKPQTNRTLHKDF